MVEPIAAEDCARWLAVQECHNLSRRNVASARSADLTWRILGAPTIRSPFHSPNEKASMMLVSAAIVAALAVAVSAKDPAEGWMVSAARRCLT